MQILGGTSRDQLQLGPETACGQGWEEGLAEGPSAPWGLGRILDNPDPLLQWEWTGPPAQASVLYQAVLGFSPACGISDVSS